MILDDDLNVCTNCGAKLEKTQFAVAPQPVVIQQTATQSVPDQYRPLGAWAYFGYQLLFALPVVGFICLIVFSCDSSNINRRNFARSYWCSLLVSVIVTVLLIVAAVAFGFGMESIASVLSSL